MVDPTSPQTEGRQKSASRRPNEEASTGDKEAAFRAIMKKQVSRVALAIKHTDVQKEELRDLFAHMCHYVRVGHELHEEHVLNRPDDHLHAYLQLSTQKRLGEIYKLVQEQLDDRYYGRPDVRQLPSHTDAAKWNNYCKKDGDYVDHGELHVAGPAPKQGKKDLAPFHEFLQIAATHGVDAAMEYASEALVEEYCTRYSALKEAADSKKVTHTKYDLPSMKAEDVTLRPWQKAWLPRVTKRAPVARVIHWVWGSPGKGKSFAHDYLQANHPHGCFNAGNRCCLDNLVYNYDEEGVILWDFPMNFDWANMSLAAAAAIEKFSDFGTSLRSLKYKGKSCYARGHVVVFANRPPIPELQHREIREFHIDDYVPPALAFQEIAPCHGPAREVPKPYNTSCSASVEGTQKRPRGRPRKKAEPQLRPESVFISEQPALESTVPAACRSKNEKPETGNLSEKPPSESRMGGLEKLDGCAASDDYGSWRCKDRDCLSLIGSDASTRAPDVNASSEAASEATTPQGRSYRVHDAT